MSAITLPITRRILLSVLALAVAAFAFRGILHRPAAALVQRVKGRATINEHLQQFGADARRRLAPDFERIALSYPPKLVTQISTILCPWTPTIRVSPTNDSLFMCWCPCTTSFGFIRSI